MPSFPYPDKLDLTSLTCLLSPSPFLVLSQLGSAMNRPGQSLPQQRLQLSSALQQQQQQALQQQQQQIQVIQQLHSDYLKKENSNRVLSSKLKNLVFWFL